MIKVIVSIIFIFIFGCSRQQDKSFDDLSLSFIDWMNASTSDFNNNESILEFNSTVKRFSLELNQINKNKLTKSKVNDYRLIKRFLEKNIFEYNREGKYRWNLISSFDQYELIQYKYEDPKQLAMINKILNIYPRDMIWKENFEFWYKNIYPKYDDFKNRSQLTHLRHNILNYPYALDSLENATEKSIKIFKDTIFKISLPIYLSSNDEPLWTDFSDTLSVVHWTSNNIDASLKSLYYSSVENDSVNYSIIQNLIDTNGNNIDKVIKDQGYMDAYTLALSYKNIINNSELSYWVKNIFKLLYFNDRLEEAIMSIVALKYYIYNEDINKSMTKYNDFNIIHNNVASTYSKRSTDSTEKYFSQKRKIYGHDYTYIIKFLSYNTLLNQIDKEVDEQFAYEKFISVLENNLNTNLNHIIYKN